LRVSFAELPAVRLLDEPKVFKASDAKTNEYNMFSFGDFNLTTEESVFLETLVEYRCILDAVKTFEMELRILV
jgi:hypothetical protein